MAETRSGRYWTSAVLLPVSAVLYVVSLTMEVATVNTTLGILGLGKTTTESYSLPRTLSVLWERGDTFLWIMIFSFTILFPVTKYLALGLVMFARDPGRSRTLTWVKNLGQWSMGDVFVVAFLVVMMRINSSVAQLSVKVEPGIYVFAVSVILSMIVSTLLAFEPRRPIESKRP